MKIIPRFDGMGNAFWWLINLDRYSDGTWSAREVAILGLDDIERRDSQLVVFFLGRRATKMSQFLPLRRWCLSAFNQSFEFVFKIQRRKKACVKMKFQGLKAKKES